MSTKLHWTSKAFTELSATELYAVMQLRVDVFILEQKCFYRELDGWDAQCMHLMAFDRKKETLAAYSRIVPPGLSFAEPAIGRVITGAGYRGVGLGQELMERSIALCQELYPKQPIRIGAQAHLQAFYGALGFRADSEIYDEDGIPHLEMLRS